MILDDILAAQLISINQLLFTWDLAKKILSNPILPTGYHRPPMHFVYLGVTIPIGKCANDLLFNLNFLSVFRKVKTTLNLWSCKGLTLLGKITILKTLVISKLTYNYLICRFPYLILILNN